MHNYHDPLVNLHDITLNLLSEDSPDELLSAILEQAIRATSAESGSIALLDEEKKYLDIKVHESLSNEAELLRLKVGEGVTGRCILTGKTRNIGNVKEDPSYVELRDDILSELASPLKIGRKTFGVLSVDSIRENAFNSDHESLIETLAEYAALIFSRIQSNQSLAHRTKMQDVLLKINGNLILLKDLEQLFRATMKELLKEIDIQSATIHLYNSSVDQLEVKCVHGFSGNQREKSIYKPGEGITGKVFQSNEHFVVEDVKNSKKFLNKSGHLNKDVVSADYVACPIQRESKCIGVLGLCFSAAGQAKLEDYVFLTRMLGQFFSQALQIIDYIEHKGSEIVEENSNLRKRLREDFSYANIVGSSTAMRDIFEKISMTADVPSPVLILGESGTGKELIASALHENGNRKQNTLVKINCAAIPADLLESELFGSVKGAYTSSVEDRKGKLLLANGGSLFLDEIGDMPVQLQSKLLRFIQEKEYSPLGSEKVIKVDVRIIAATNANIGELIQQKKFREDLFYRLNVIRIELPPLRERKTDLPALIQSLLKKIVAKTGKKVSGIQPDAMMTLESYDFPGNIRELENILERAVVLSKNKKLEPADIQLPAQVFKPINQTPAEPLKETAADAFSMPEWVKQEFSQGLPGEIRAGIFSQVDRELINHALKKNRYNKSKTASMLGINRLTLDKKIADLNLLEID